MYCGVVVSSNSQPAGTPRLLMSRSSRRAIRKPRSISKLPSRPGSLINPFHPIVVRGFSKIAQLDLWDSVLDVPELQPEPERRPEPSPPPLSFAPMLYGSL